MHSEYGSVSPPASPPFRDERYFEDDYKVEQVLGEGTYSVVRKCINRNNGDERAVKIIFKDEMRVGELEIVEKEVEILSTLNNENILSLYDFYDEDDCIFIVTEMYQMNLLDYINTYYDKLTEARIKFIFKKITNGIEYCHYNNIMHRDLKPENILINIGEDGYISELKVADFGMASEISQNISNRDIFGSPGYKAPEGLKGKIKYD